MRKHNNSSNISTINKERQMNKKTKQSSNNAIKQISDLGEKLRSKISITSSNNSSLLSETLNSIDQSVFWADPQLNTCEKSVYIYLMNLQKQNNLSDKKRISVTQEYIAEELGTYQETICLALSRLKNLFLVTASKVPNRRAPLVYAVVNIRAANVLLRSQPILNS